MELPHFFLYFVFTVKLSLLETLITSLSLFRVSLLSAGLYGMNSS